MAIKREQINKEFIEMEAICKKSDVQFNENGLSVVTQTDIINIIKQAKNNNDKYSLPDHITEMLIKEVRGTWEAEGVSFGLTQDEGDELEEYLDDNNLGN